MKSREKCIRFSMVDKGESTYSNRAVSIPIHKFLMKEQQKIRQIYGMKLREEKM